MTLIIYLGLDNDGHKTYKKGKFLLVNELHNKIVQVLPPVGIGFSCFPMAANNPCMNPSWAVIDTTALKKVEHVFFLKIERVRLTLRINIILKYDIQNLSCSFSDLLCWFSDGWAPKLIKFGESFFDNEMRIRWSYIRSWLAFIASRHSVRFSTVL